MVEVESTRGWEVRAAVLQKLEHSRVAEHRRPESCSDEDSNDDIERNGWKP